MFSVYKSIDRTTHVWSDGISPSVTSCSTFSSTLEDMNPDPAAAQNTTSELTKRMNTRNLFGPDRSILARDSDYVVLFGHSLESDVVPEALGTYSLAKVGAGFNERTEAPNLILDFLISYFIVWRHFQLMVGRLF